MKERKLGQSATGSNPGPQHGGRPESEDADIPMGTTSDRGPDYHAQRKQGKPPRGSRNDTDTTP